jgi:1,4-alpha-glucan branching enzyme
MTHSTQTPSHAPVAPATPVTPVTPAKPVAPGHPRSPHLPLGQTKKAATFSKIFRWQQESPGPMPVKVEVAGTFSQWQKLPLKYDRVNRQWQLTLENIQGNRTHNYMLLVNGRPTADKNSDGFAVPHTEEEKQHALATPRGPRVFMLFSQTK